jgi:multiple sugar transport system substrate-binding protein
MHARFLAALLLAAPPALAQPTPAPVELHAFVSPTLRPDLMRQAFATFEARHPGVTVAIEQGGATSELQGQYLDTVLSARDSTLDLFMLDVIRPAQFAAAGWIVPLDDAVGDKAKFLADYLPAYAEADQVGGKLVALPGFADAMMLYYRKDLLDKYHQPVPTTWDQLAQVARVVMDGEKDPQLGGVSFQGKAIEGAVCTFLLPYWSQGKSLVANGKPTFDRDAAIKSFDVWLGLIHGGVAPKNAAEVGTDDTRQEFQAGRDVFAVLWSYGWAQFQGKDSPVAGKVGVAPLPAVAGGQAVTCLGGWQWGVSAFSKHRAEAVELARFMSSPEVGTLLAERGSLLPVFPSLYHDPAVEAAAPFLGALLPVVEGAKARPVTPRYNQVSDAVRTITNAVLAGQTAPDEGAAEMDARLRRALR